MRNAVRSEVRKVLSTRSVWLLLLLGLVLEVVSSFVGMAAGKPIDFPASLDQISFLHFGTTNVCLLFVILGIRAVGDEFAYDTITPSLQADPNRGRILAAKAITYAGAAASFAIMGSQLPGIKAIARWTCGGRRVTSELIAERMKSSAAAAGKSSRTPLRHCREAASWRGGLRDASPPIRSRNTLARMGSRSRPCKTRPSPTEAETFASL